MRAAISVTSLLALSAACAPRLAQSDLDSLYKARKWAELHAAVKTAKGNALYRGAAAVVFNDNPQESERDLRSVIQSNPQSNEAYDAYEWLSHLYLRTGQYHQLSSIMEARWAAFPEKAERIQEQRALAAFYGLPDQAAGTFRPSTVSHEAGAISIPLSVNGIAADYFFDTGAWVSSISESEAKRVGLNISAKSGTMGTATSPASFRTAVADEVAIGDIHFKNVSFAVFSDDGEPWSVLQPGHKGIIGIPLIVGFRTLRWVRDGAMEVGGKSKPLDVRRSNIQFEDDHLVIEADLQEQQFMATLDTGSLTTDLFDGFVKQYPSLLNKSGKKDSTEVRGVGGIEVLDSMELPALKFRIGGHETVLSPARVFIGKNWHKCCVANIGMDLLKQAHAFKIDFQAMTLALEGRD